jgi:hypothetical protein
MKRDARGKRTSLTNVVSRPCQSVTVVLCRADIENRLCLMYVRGAENRTKTTMDSSLSSNPEPKHEQPLPLSLQWFRRNHTHTRRPATCLPLLLHFPRRYVFWCLGRPFSLHLVRLRREGRRSVVVGASERSRGLLVCQRRPAQTSLGRDMANEELRSLLHLLPCHTTG